MPGLPGVSLERRRAARSPVRIDTVARRIAWGATGGAWRELRVRVVNLSPAGAGVRSRWPIHTGDRLRVAVPSRALARRIPWVESLAIWVQPPLTSLLGHYRVGVIFWPEHQPGVDALLGEAGTRDALPGPAGGCEGLGAGPSC